MGWMERRDKVIEFLKKQKWLLWFFGVPIVVCIAYLFLWVLPKWQVSQIPCLPLKECSNLENEYRKTWAQILGGIGLFIGILLTLRRVQAIEKTAAIALDSQITERFTKAIEQLGSDELAVRLGGIYALERIAKDSDKDYWPIMEVLTAYARENTRFQEEPTSNEVESPSNANTQQQPPELATDIQAILTVIGRRSKTFGNGEIYPIDLTLISAIGANLRGAHLEGALFGGAHLEHATLSEAHLEGAFLFEAYLEGAFLEGARLEKANLFEARLEGAYLEGAHLDGAFLGGTNLEGADLRGVLGLTKAQLQGATIDSATKLPEHLKKNLGE